MTVNIFSETFLVFYKLLLNGGKVFLSNEDKKKRDYKNNSYKLWELKTEVEKITVINKVMAPDTYAPSYWNDRKSKHNSRIKHYRLNNIEEPAYLPEQASAIITALKFLDFKTPEELSGELTEGEEAQLLYEQFLKKECKVFLKKYPVLSDQHISENELVEDVNANQELDINITTSLLQKFVSKPFRYNIDGQKVLKYAALILGTGIGIFVLYKFYLSRQSQPIKQQIANNHSVKSAEIDSTGFSVIGEWKRLGDDTLHVSSELTISAETKKGFRFSFFAMYGMNTGELEGFANFNQNGSKAFAVETNYDSCQTSFLFQKDPTGKHIIVTSTCQGGMNVVFDGDYFKPEEYLIKRKILDEVGFTDFYNVVGEDKIYFEQAIQVYSDEEEDLDFLDTKVTIGHIGSAYDLSGAIIMYNKVRGFIYTAVLDGKNLEYLRYYTNDKKYIKTLPKTIERWRKHFKFNYKIRYCSVKQNSQKLQSSEDF